MSIMVRITPRIMRIMRITRIINLVNLVNLIILSVILTIILPEEKNNKNKSNVLSKSTKLYSILRWFGLNLVLCLFFLPFPNVSLITWMKWNIILAIILQIFLRVIILTFFSTPRWPLTRHVTEDYEHVNLVILIILNP